MLWAFLYSGEGPKKSKEKSTYRGVWNSEWNGGGLGGQCAKSCVYGQYGGEGIKSTKDDERMESKKRRGIEAGIMHDGVAGVKVERIHRVGMCSLGVRSSV